jgi:hypothetical protein
MRRFSLIVVIAAMVVGLSLVGAWFAFAGAPTKTQVLSDWTRSDVSSFNSWNAARQKRSDWSKYSFDWSTDYCSESPDDPLGFNFELACARHDFGYRNYKAVNQFEANKSRIDDAFYQDLLRSCHTYWTRVRPVCDGLAWTYYQAVRVFASVFERPGVSGRAEYVFH